MPRSTGLDLPSEEQVQMLTALRRARYGYLMALYTVYTRNVAESVKECSQSWYFDKIGSNVSGVPCRVDCYLLAVFL